jgi:hypothetical protein
MAKDENKWTRERGFWERNAAEITTIVACVIFLFLMVGAVGFVLFKPEIPGLSNAFKAPPAPPPGPPGHNQKFLYSVPGEVEVLIYPGKPVQIPAAPPQKPAESKK